MGAVSYKFYPSLLDKFQRFLDAERDFEDPRNVDAETGEYRKTLEEISDGLEQELLDAVNRVPREPSEAADKGTCFNEIIDCLIHSRPCGHEGMTIRSYRAGEMLDGVVVPSPFIRATLDGFTFDFDMDMCRAAADYFAGAVSQYRCSACLATRYGWVELYGFIDEIVQDTVRDIKTTSRYSFGKYEDGWQKHVYPFCLVESGDMPSVKEFEYTVYQWRERKYVPLNAVQYREVYTYDHERTRERLTQMCERFIEWLEDNRGRITDGRIFGK